MMAILLMFLYVMYLLFVISLFFLSFIKGLLGTVLNSDFSTLTLDFPKIHSENLELAERGVWL